jgi:hypothetical protein
MKEGTIYNTLAIEFAQDIKRWRAFLNAVKNLWVQKCGKVYD